MQSCDNLEKVFSVIQPEWRSGLSLFHERGSNMDSPHHTCVQIAVEIVRLSERPSAQRGQRQLTYHGQIVRGTSGIIHAH